MTTTIDIIVDEEMAMEIEKRAAVLGLTESSYVSMVLQYLLAHDDIHTPC